VHEKQARDIKLAESGEFDKLTISGLLDLMRHDDHKARAWAEFGRRNGFL
jgi:hypothetical protein